MNFALLRFRASFMQQSEHSRCTTSRTRPIRFSLHGGSNPPFSTNNTARLLAGFVLFVKEGGASKLLCLRGDSKGAAMFCTGKTASRGRKKFLRRQKLICDQVPHLVNFAPQTPQKGLRLFVFCRFHSGFYAKVALQLNNLKDLTWRFSSARPKSRITHKKTRHGVA